MKGISLIVLKACMLSLFLCLVFLTGGCKRSSSVEGKLVWADAVGDVQGVVNLPDRPILDLQSVTVYSANGELVVELDIKNLKKLLDYVSADGKRYGASLVDIVIDTDLDPNTGGAPLSLWHFDTKPKRFGYDFRIPVLAGFRSKTADGGSGRSTGDISLENAKYVTIEPIISYQIWSLGSQRLVARKRTFPRLTVTA